MFGGFGQPSSSPFGQSTSSPFGQSLFGQNNNNNTNPFAPKPFGSPTANPFGSQTGGSIFGGTSTGVFGQTPSPLATAPTFGASSSPAFGSSTPAFGASTTPAFGAASSAFGGSSLFGQKPAFGGFGSTTGQSNPFGSSFQQTQPTFGSSPFGSTTSFGASSQPAFGASSTPAFGASTVSSFGATSAPAFGATAPTFGSTTTPLFGSTSTPAFGATTTPAFGAASTPAFGSTTFGTQGTTFGFSTPAFGSTPSFGSGSSPIFGASTTPAFGTSSTSAFGAPSTPSFSFGSAPAFGQSTPAFGTTTFGTIAFGGQSTTPAFGSTVFGQSTFGQQAGQQGGSRLAPYAPTVDADGATGTQPAGKLESISAMPAYKEKSHEELRWEDYQRGDKGGPNPAGQPAAGVGFPAATQTNPFGQTGAFGQTTASSFSSTSAGLFGQKSAFPTTGFSQTTGAFSSPFGTASSSPFGSSSSTSLFGGQSAPGFSASTTPLFGSTAAPFGAVSSFGSSAASLTTPTFNTGLNFNTQPAGLFQSSATGQTSLFGQTSGFGQLPGSNIFGAQSTGFGSIFGTSSSLTPTTPMGFSQTTPSLSSPFQPATPVPASGGFSFGNFGQSQPVASGFAGISNIFAQSNAQPTTQTSVVLQPTSITNPFGTLPAMPQMSIGRAGASSSIQYGISNMPVSEKPIPVRVSSLLTPRHLSQRRVRLPSRKYSSKTDSPKVAFFYDEEEPPSTPKADALFIPRENPRALVIRPVEQWPSRNTNEKNLFTVVRENGKVAVDVPVTAEKESISNGGGGITVQNQDNDKSKSPPETNGFQDDYHANGIDSSTSSYTLFTGKRAGEAAIVYEHGADIEALMPKLRHPEYYTEPQIPELAAKERAVPGFCCHVKDFVVGRHGYGNIKFEGETDVRRLDLESVVQFNNREVIVYKDENKKPPIGQGLNKPAEVTLLNVKCADKKTGRQYTEGPKVENYRELLRKKAEEQGAKFVSYDPLKGEWRFKVDHFSSYGIGEVSASLLTTISELEGNKQKLLAS